jgi:hypothetical protein
MKLKKIMLIMIVLCVICSLFGVSSASNINTLNVDKVLQDYGYESNVTSVMPYRDKVEISKSILENPDSIEILQTYLTVDNLALIEYYTNIEDTELIKNGLNNDDIKKIRNWLQKLNSISEAEMKEYYGIDFPVYKLVKKALTKNKDYHNEDFGEKTVTTSDTISTTKMSYSMTKTDVSTSTAPSYNFYITYNWLSTYFNDIFDDSIAVAWGGNLNSTNIASLANYNLVISGMFTDYVDSYAWTKNETPNSGIVFSTPQSKGYTIYGQYRQNKSGYVRFNLYQTKYNGKYDTNVVSRFLHKVVSIAGGSVSVTGATINFDSGSYDSTDQSSATVKY